MFGYVVTQKEELKLREFQVYNGYYCGLCKTIGSDYSHILRIGLQFEMVFLALFLESLDASPDTITEEHCIVHHIKKKPVIRCDALHYAATMTAILGYEKYRDDLQDDGTSLKTIAESIPLKHAYARSKADRPDLASAIAERLAILYDYEKAGDTTIDNPTNAFGEVMRIIFTGYFTDSSDDMKKRIVGEFAYQLGRWIYLMDAIDDIEKDEQTGSFNPLKSLDKEQRKPLVRTLLYHALGEMSKAADLLEFLKNRNIIDNILYLGLRQRTEEVLKSADDRESCERL